MIEMYRYINACKITSNVIALDHTDNRVLNFDMWLALSLGLLLIIQVFSYNRQDTLELCFTILLLALVFIISKYKNKICHKSVVFNRKKGTICFKRNFLNIDRTFMFSKIEIITKNKVVSDDTDTYRYKSYYIKEKYSNEKYKICETNDNQSFDYFINNYMKSDVHSLKKLIKYDKKEDPELKKVHHL